MSNTEPRPSISGNVLIITLSAVFVAVVAVCAMIFIGAPESKNPVGLISVLLGAFSTFIVAIGTLVQVGKVKNVVDDLANGKADRKTRVAIADMIDPAYLRDDAHAQLAIDRVTIAQDKRPA